MEDNLLNKHICLAVLPFQVLSDNATVGLCCKGLVMDLITDLSRFRFFHIIALEATQDLNPDELAGSRKIENLNLDYLLKGMVRHLQDKLLFNLQLINIRKKHVVWAEKYERSIDDIFQIQEDMVEKIVVSLQQFVDYDLLNEIRKKPVTSLNVYECWLRGFHELKKGTCEADEQARLYFRQAMEMDPHYPRAYMGMSLSYFNEWSCQLWSRWEVSKNGAFEWAQRALELDEWDHVCNAIVGRIYLYNGEYEKAEHFLRKSLRINANDTETLVVIAVSFTYLGYFKESIELYERVKRLNPVHSFTEIGAFIFFEAGQIDEAIALGEKTEDGKAWVDFPAYQSAAYYLKGDTAKMQERWQVYLQEFTEKINSGKQADTQSALQWMIDANPYRNETRLRPFWDYMGEVDSGAVMVEKERPVSARQNLFSKEGELWTVSFGGRQVQLPDLKGYYDLAQLLDRPNQSIHCTELMGAQVIEKGEAVFDRKAKENYKKRILELQQEIKEAENTYDSDRLMKLEDEYDAMIQHLSRATGVGGNARKVSGTIEKCRAAVTWRIRSAIRKIAETHPRLGKHLELSVKTGIFCEYAPEQEMNWVL